MTTLLSRLKKSLTTRLLLVFIVTGILIMSVLFVIIAQGFAQQWRTNARPHMEQYLDFISEEIGTPPNAENAKALADRLDINIYINGPNFSYSTNAQALDLHDVSFRQGKRNKSRFKHQEHAPRNIEFSGNEDRTLLKNTLGDYQVYYELPHLNDDNLTRSMLPALLAALGLLGACYLVIRRMLKPVQDIKIGVKAMGAGNLAHRVPIRQDNDLGELSQSINTMATDIEQMLDAKRQLLLGASHELRSPITRAKVALQLMEDSPQRQSVEDDLQEMESLISDILESERMKSGHASLQLKPVNVLALVQSVVEETHASNVAIECMQPDVQLRLDETRMRILLRNIIANALIHHGNHTNPIKVNIAYDQNQDQASIQISDSGPGIDPEHLALLTEPFYRTDSSRTRSTGGFGLGLHLAKLIATAHGGDLVITSQSKNENGQDLIEKATGTTASLLLPIHYNIDKSTLLTIE